MPSRIKRAARSALLALAICASLLIGRAEAAQSISGEDLVARLDRAIASATDGRTAPSRARMGDVLTSIGLPVDVAVNGGTIRIPRDPILDKLVGIETRDFDVALVHLRQMRSGIEALLGVRSVPVPDVALALRGTQSSPSFLQQVRELWDRFLSVLEHGVVTAASSGWGAVAFVVIALAIALSLIVFLARRVRMVQQRTVRPESVARAADPATALAEALRRGDLDAAVRAQFSLLAHELALGGLVPEGPALTAGECRQAVRSRRGALYPVVREATEAFERVAYGHTPPTEEHVHVLRRATEAVRAA